MDPSGSSASGSNGRQKRVLPSRARRGGPGVGTCETDIMILEHQKRRFETEAVIPLDTPFLLTTDDKLSSSLTGTAVPSVTTVASERYFDRPDVLKAYREQLTIQTPTFINVSGRQKVARFRPRGPEDAYIDTSDAAYERRHRKYESFEKRQRLREKEKLQHEQYKLKERIEQLRVMDASAFLALPASHFSPAPGVSEEDIEVGIASLPSAYVNGTIPHNEGERRRKEMLDIALALEERYRVLLPRDRMRRTQPQPAVRENVPPAPVPFRRAVSDIVESEQEGEDIYVDGGYGRLQEKIKIKLKPWGKGSTSQSPAPTSTSRASKRSTGTSAPPPPAQKPMGRRRSRAVASPTPPPSPSGLGESMQLNPYPNFEPPPSPPIEPEEIIEEEDIGLESEGEVVPSPSMRGHTSEHKIEMDSAEGVPRSQAHVSSSPQPIPSPQRHSPPDEHPVLTPQLGPVLLEQETLPEEPTESLELPMPEENRPEDSPIHIDEEPEPAPAPVQDLASMSLLRHPTPPSLEIVQYVYPPPKPTEAQSVPRRHSKGTRRAEEGSRLLELANAVHSLTTTPPPTKRQKVWHPQSPPKLQESSIPPPASPTPSPSPQQVAELEREPIPTALAERIVTVEEPLQKGEMIVSSPPHHSPSPPPVPIPRSPTVSEYVPPSTTRSASVLFAQAPESISASVSAVDAYSSFSTFAGPSTAYARRRAPWTRKQLVEYKSETGELRRTECQLLIAGIRGSVRQTQRHQMAFGAKVPEEISKEYDFWLPDEFLPEEELMKYQNYEYGVVARTGV